MSAQKRHSTTAKVTLGSTALVFGIESVTHDGKGSMMSIKQSTKKKRNKQKEYVYISHRTRLRQIHLMQEDGIRYREKKETKHRKREKEMK